VAWLGVYTVLLCSAVHMLVLCGYTSACFAPASSLARACALYLLCRDA
jgi:hypothetical protein